MSDHVHQPVHAANSSDLGISAKSQVDPRSLDDDTRDLDILYQDEHLVAIDKPAGVLTHRSRIAADRGASAMERIRDQLGAWVYPIHRLDRATSGVLLFALNPSVARAAQEVLMGGQVTKRYLAVTRGYAPEQAEVTRALQERPDRITDQLATPNKPPQAAHTSLTTWAYCSLGVSIGRYPTTRLSLVEARPHTGRRHQIRRHLAGLSYPLVGDTSHGRGELNRLFRERYGCHRLLLASLELSLPHPVSGAQMTIEAPLRGVMAQVCAELFLEERSSDQASGSESPPRESLVWLSDPQSLRQRFASS